MLNLNDSYSGSIDIKGDYYDISLSLIVTGARLTSLDVSSRSLTFLNVLGCPALKKLWCNENKLTALDVSKNSELIYLNLASNKLSALDVSKNNVLKQLLCTKKPDLTTLTLKTGQSMFELQKDDHTTISYVN